jgi:hypothetical protein
MLISGRGKQVAIPGTVSGKLNETTHFCYLAQQNTSLWNEPTEQASVDILLEIISLLS